MVDAIKKYNKIIISVIAVLAIFAVLPFIVKKGTNSLTERDRRLVNYDQYQDGDELIDGTDYVTFDAYFYEDIAGTPTKMRGEYLNINQKASLWIDLHVFGDVKLKNAKLTLVNGNVKTSGYLYKSSIIPSNIGIPNGGDINLKPEISGATLNNKITISENITNDLSSFSKENKIILTGIVEKPNGEETEITKEVKYTVDWYLDDLTTQLGTGGGGQNFPYKVVYDCKNGDGTWKYHHEWLNTNYQITYTIKAYTNNPFAKSVNFSAQIPDLNGYDPVSVRLDSSSTSYNYNSETQTLTVTNNAVIDGTLIKKKAYNYSNNGVYYNEYKIIIEYPKEVESESQTIQIPTSVYYEFYQNGENGNVEIVTSDVKEYVFNYSFNKPFIRTTIGECGPLERDRLEFFYRADIGDYSELLRIKYINKTAATKLYNGDNDADKATDYSVSWDVNLSYFDKFEEDSIRSLILTDINSDTANESSLDKISTYKSLKFIGAENYLGTNGYVKIINNDTDEVIHVLTAIDWNNTYTFDTNVSSIRIETSELVDKTRMKNHYDVWRWQDDYTLDLFNVEIVKKIDNQKMLETYDRDTFDSFNYINTNFKVGAIRYRSDYNREEEINNGTVFAKSATYRNLQSANVTLSVSPSALDTTNINNVNLSINTGEFHDIVEGYKNGEFLIVLPESILDLEINEITINDSNVKITAYEKTEIDGKKCIKILTENNTDATYSITIKTEMIPDARLMNSNDIISLYAYNPGTDLSENKSQDIYDVDGDGNTTENQNYAAANVKLSAPNEIITTTTINYKDLDDNVSTVVSPMTADVNPVENKSDAEIEIGITNNSLYPTQDFKVIGKIGFIGNTYQIGDGDLGSEFDVTMTNSGINIPNELVGKATVYYSTQAEPTDDINDPNNGWTKSTDIQDLSNIKTYMVIIDDYTLPVGEKISFTYNVDMPNTTANLNKKTFFTHGVYYNIVTDAGLLPSNVGGAKLGINIARRYNVDLTNYKYNTDYLIKNSKYVATAKDSNDNILDQKILNVKNGKALARNLYAGYEYELTQLSVENPLILDEEVKKFKVTNDANDQLVLTTEGIYKSATLDNSHLVSLVLENETRYNIVIKNTDLDSDLPIEGSVFKITGKGFEDGFGNYTNSNGELYISGLYLNETYKLEQLSAVGYIPFKIGEYNREFYVTLKRNSNNDISIAIQKKPTVSYGENMTNGFTYSTTDDPNTIRWLYRKDTSTYATNTAYLELDLTEFSENYQLKIDYYQKLMRSRYYTTGYFRSYIVDDLSATDYGYVINDSSTQGSNSVTISNYIQNGETKPLVGGKKYYIILDTYSSNATYNNNFYISTLTLQNVNDTDEFVAVAQRENYPIDEAARATETIIDNNSGTVPILIVNVKNKKTPKYTLEITKVDSETKQPLAGAQYKISGGNLPESGKYITTDENGKASIELDESISIDYALFNSSNSWFELTRNDSLYISDIIVEEVVAPVGYQKSDKTIKYVGHQKHTALCDNNGVCDQNTYKVIHYPNYNTESEDQFKSFEYDESTGTYKVTLEDNPIIKITKKDAETGEFLPNTLFALYKVETVNGIRVFSPAIDANGNIIGNKVTINNEEFYVVSTNENGSLNLSLPAGQYKIQEVQAADEKYTLDNTSYYFGVGETVPYKAEGISYIGNYDLEKYNDSYYGTENDYITTSDGGIVFTSDNYVIKYDSNFNQIWKTDVTTENRYNYGYNTPEGLRWEFPENDTSHKYDTARYAHHIVELADGSYAVTVGSYDYIYGNNFVIKLDANGNKVWQNEEYSYTSVGQYMNICDIEQDEEVPDYLKVTGDDSHKYCQGDTPRWEYLNYSYSYYINNIVATSDGGLYVLTTAGNSSENGKYGFRLADGTTVFTPISGTPEAQMNMYMLKYDANGNLVSATEIGDRVIAASENFLESLNMPEEEWNNLRCMFDGYKGNGYYGSSHHCDYGYYNSGASYMQMYDDGSMLFVPATTRYNYPIAIKLDSNLNVLFFTIIGINGALVPNEQNDYYQGPKLTISDDGGFTYQTENSTNRNYNSDPTFTKYLPRFDIPEEKAGSTYSSEISPAYGEWILKYDSNGKPEKATEYIRKDINPSLDVIYGNNDKKRIASSYYNLHHIDTGDGYIVYNQYYPWCSSCHYPTTLKSGETIRFNNNTNYLLFKVDYDSNVEWVKQYKVDGFKMDTWFLYYRMRFDSEGRLHVPVYARNTGDSTPFIEELEAGDNGLKLYNTSTQGTDNNMQNRFYDLVFELSDEISPSGPEAYTLNIENKRKEYKITSTSNVGGNVKVTKPDGTDETINNGTLETVKYGDDNVNTITITPEAGYVISSVKVNGEDASYTVNDDGSVTLDTIKDIKENKTVNVTFEYGKSTVIVKHYLNGTTDSVFSDEIITGTITSPYSVDPKSSDLYSVASENGEIILPDNMTGTFKVEPQTVIFYYVENEVELRINYYVDGTETELAPTNVERKVLRSRYQTAPLEITNYELTRTIGEEEGTLTQDVTEVTYMYQEATESTITIRYVDKDTNKDIIDPIVKTVPIHEPYTTDDPVELPAKYRYTSVSGVPSGNADDAEIEVIYYYEVIPFNISVDKKINSVLLNGEKQTITDGKNVSISPKKLDNLIVYYEIEVKNTGDIPATFKVVEGEVPGFEIYDIGEFTKVGDNYVLDVELQPGDTKTYKIGYKWNQKDYGISTNKVEINEVTGKEGYPEPDEDDNKSTATVETKIPTKDVIPDTIIIPDTVDKIMTSIMIFIGSLIGILTSLILIRKKRMN